MYFALPPIQVPVIKDKKPVVSYIGDSVVLECKLKHTPNTWNWYKANNTDKVKKKWGIWDWLYYINLNLFCYWLIFSKFFS